MVDVTIAILTTLGWIGTLSVWLLLNVQGQAVSLMLKRYIRWKFIAWSILILVQTLYYLDVDLQTAGTQMSWLRFLANDATGQILFRGLLAVATWNFIRDILRPQKVFMAPVAEAQIQIDVYGKIVDWDAQAMMLFGWTASEVLGKDLADFIIPVKYRDAHHQGLTRYRATTKAPLLNQRLIFPACTKTNGEKIIELRIKENLTSRGTIFTAMISPALVIK